MKLKSNIAVSENGFIFDSSTGESYSVNETGADLMQLIREEKSFEEIKAFFEDEYNLSNQNFERYYDDFISLLIRYNLVESSDADNV